jgi:3',5'-cyclic AMP phosphodiesterase CpdA
MRRAMGWLILGVTVAAGCGSSSVPRDRVTFAVLAGVYYSAEPGTRVEAAMVEDSESLLRKAVADLNAAKKLDFVIIAGDLFASADGLALDRAKAILADLRVPYYAVLGSSDGPEGAMTAPAATSAGQSAGEPPHKPWVLSRSAIIWAFQGRGFSGTDGYWSREVMPGLVLVGLDTAERGRGIGHVDARQLAWLDQTLAAHAGEAVVVVGYHELVAMHPLDEGAAWRHKWVDNAAEVRQVLERHPNVLAVLAGDGHFAEGRIVGRTLYLASPSVSVWPLAYHLVRFSPKEAEAVWVPLGDDDLTRRAQERLLASPPYRGVFPAGEDGDTACVRLFGGKKMEIYPLPTIRP